MKGKSFFFQIDGISYTKNVSRVHIILIKGLAIDLHHEAIFYYTKKFLTPLFNV